MDNPNVQDFRKKLDMTDINNPDIESNIILDTVDGKMSGKIIAHTIWENNAPRYTGVIGKISDLKKIF